LFNLKGSIYIDDVVVVGYTSVKRKDLLASVSSISAKDLKDVPVNSAAGNIEWKIGRRYSDYCRRCSGCRGKE
jgi:hypothetical protein